MSALVFSLEEDELFIELVQKLPVLYDSAHMQYKNVMIKDSMWKEISQNTGKYAKQEKNLTEKQEKKKMMKKTNNPRRIRSKQDKLAVKTVKKLPAKGINEVKLKTLALVAKTEEKYAALQQQTTSNSTAQGLFNQPIENVTYLQISSSNTSTSTYYSTYI